MAINNIDRVMNCPIERKIISFFYENPSTVDTCDGIATWIGEEAGRVRKSLKELVKLNILVAHHGITTGYGYTQDNDILSRINVLLKRRRRDGGREKITKTSTCKFSENKN